MRLSTAPARASRAQESAGAAFLLSLFWPSTLFGATFPADADWNPLVQSGQGMGDITGDGQNNGREVVGEATDPAVFVYADATHFFVRLRLDEDPLQSAANLRPYGWGLLFDIDDDLSSYEYSLLVDGISEEILLAQNTSPGATGDPTDQAETDVSGYPVVTDHASGGNVQVTAAPTAFDGTADYFLDFAVTLADVQAALGSGPIAFIGGSSSGARYLSVDLAGCDDGGTCTLADAASDPSELDGTVLEDSDADGLLDIEEDLDGDSDPANDDSDGDGTPDYLDDDDDDDGLLTVVETTGGTDHLDDDSDDDGLLDGTEDSDGDGVLGGSETDPTAFDSDGDGLGDGLETGLTAPEGTGTDASIVLDSDPTTTTDPLDDDTDGDTLLDGTEDADGDGAVGATETDPNDPADGSGDADGDGYDSITAGGLDCNDALATAYPGAAEITADGVDQDCDSVDSCYTDTDGDNYGTPVVTDGSSTSCATGTGATVSTDCDDTSATVNPAASELTGDAVDQDCDGTERCYTDADGDGYRADDGTTVTSADTDCSDTGEALATTPTGDCNDASAAYNPGAAEPDCADPTDYNCDGASGTADGDGDGWAACEECDDADDAVNPDATELPGDSVDQDCDGSELCYVDADEDGYRPDEADTVASTRLACDGRGEALDAEGGDCDDGAPTVHPGATELPGDEVDQDCDGGELCYVDADADGYTADDPAIVVSDDALCDAAGEASAATPAGDCDDTNDAYNPGALEADCDDPTDYNCDGSSGTADSDADGFAACAECDDADAAVNPGAAEVCNAVDDDCDGTVDVDATDAETWYADADRDGYTDPHDAVTACDPPAGYVAAAEDDCDDADAPSHPGGDDVPGDGLDQDCDGADAIADSKETDCGCAAAPGAAWSFAFAALMLARRRRPAT